jgi:glyoxylase-like metal-dependent hydrolase (beta-lactamase superfamily II)
VPIKPENRHRYPKDWPQIRAAVLLRADNKCEGSPLFPDCRVPNGAWRQRWSHEWTMRQAVAQFWKGNGYEVSGIVLTIGHLDHTPENCDLANLRAWCQRCHLNYDAHHHAETAYMTRRAGRAMEMFE